MAEESSKPVVCTFESRRADEMCSLIERFGGRPLSAPSMKEVPVEQNIEAVHAVEKIVGGQIQAMVLLTGVGTEAMLQIAESHGLKENVLNIMSSVPLLVRGPKPAAVLSRLGLKYAVKAPEPNTWKELIAAIDDSGIPLNDQCVAVQEYGITNPELNQALEDRGAAVLPICVYRWALPDDTGPLENAIRKTAAGDIDVLLFTSAQQIRHVLSVADDLQLKDKWHNAVGQTTVASIGPTCSDALRDAGIDVDFEAAPPKMGPLVRGALEYFELNRR